MGAMAGERSIDFQARSSRARRRVFPELFSHRPIKVRPVVRWQHNLFLDALLGGAGRLSERHPIDRRGTGVGEQLASLHQFESFHAKAAEVRPAMARDFADVGKR